MSWKPIFASKNCCFEMWWDSMVRQTGESKSLNALKTIICLQEELLFFQNIFFAVCRESSNFALYGFIEAVS
jgi:hypothetical protein